MTQEQLRELEDAQRAAWFANTHAAKLAQRVRAALVHGAELEPGRLYFDVDLEMVRSKRRTG